MFVSGWRMDIECITDSRGTLELASAWDELVAGAGGDALFRSWDWVSSWWDAYAAALGAERVVVACREGGTLVGLAPLYTAPRGGSGLAGRVGGRVLRFLGSGGDTAPDYLNVLARPGREREVAQELVGFLGGRSVPRWDALDLTDLCADEPMTAALDAALRERFGFTTARTPHAVCPFVALAPSVEAHGAAMPVKLRYNVRSRRRKLERDHGGRFFVWDDGPRVGEAIERLADLHRRRFTARGERHGFSSEAYVAFHRDVAARFFRRGALRLYCLEADGQLVAMLYAFHAGDTVYHYQSGFDPDWAQAGVGQVVVAAALEHAIGEGARRFDFLKGEYAYKDQWATGRRQTARLLSARLRPAGLAHLYGHVVRPALGRCVRGVFQ